MWLQVSFLNTKSCISAWVSLGQTVSGDNPCQQTPPSHEQETSKAGTGCALQPQGNKTTPLLSVLVQDLTRVALGLGCCQQRLRCGKRAGKRRLPVYQGHGGENLFSPWSPAFLEFVLYVTNYCTKPTENRQNTGCSGRWLRGRNPALFDYALSKLCCHLSPAMNCNRSPGRRFQRLTPAWSAPAFKAGAAVGCGVGCGAAGTGEAANSPLLSQIGSGVRRREGDGERWGCGSGANVLDVELVKERGGTTIGWDRSSKEKLLSLVLGGGIVPPATQRTFAALRCPPTTPTYYGELYIPIIMGKTIFLCITWMWFTNTSAKPPGPRGVRLQKAKACTNNNLMLEMGNRNLLIYVGSILATWGHQICYLIFRPAAL